MLFLPGVIGVLLFESAIPGKESQLRISPVFNILLVFNLALVVSVNAYFVVAFEKATVPKRRYLTLNALLPVAFLVLYFLFVVYSSFAKYQVQHVQQVEPVRTIHLGFMNYLILGMLLYAAVNFLYLNKELVMGRIRRIEDQAQQLQLSNKFLLPMKRITRAALLTALGLFVLVVFIDLKMLFF